MTISGDNFSATTRTWQSSDFDGSALPLSLDGVRVKMNGRDVPVYSISPRQITALAPTQVGLGAVSVTVTTPQGTSAPANASVQLFAPSWLETARGIPAALHADGIPVGPAPDFGDRADFVPAEPSERIALYGTGFGPTSPPVDSLTRFSGAAPLATLTDLRVTVGGERALVEFAGLVSNGPPSKRSSRTQGPIRGAFSGRLTMLAVQAPEDAPALTGMTPAASALTKT